MLTKIYQLQYFTQPNPFHGHPSLRKKYSGVVTKHKGNLKKNI